MTQNDYSFLFDKTKAFIDYNKVRKSLTKDCSEIQSKIIEIQNKRENNDNLLTQKINRLSEPHIEASSKIIKRTKKINRKIKVNMSQEIYEQIDNLINEAGPQFKKIRALENSFQELESKLKSEWIELKTIKNQLFKITVKSVLQKTILDLLPILFIFSLITVSYFNKNTLEFITIFNALIAFLIGAILFHFILKKIVQRVYEILLKKYIEKLAIWVMTTQRELQEMNSSIDSTYKKFFDGINRIENEQK